MRKGKQQLEKNLEKMKKRKHSTALEDTDDFLTQLQKPLTLYR